MPPRQSLTERRASSTSIALSLSKISSAEKGWRMEVDDGGKHAVTRWRRIEVAEGQSLVEFRPQTGRTHQLRIHAVRGLGAPIVGDPVYGAGEGGGTMTAPNAGMLLHASRLAVPRPPREEIDVSAPVPERFGRWLDHL